MIDGGGHRLAARSLIERRAQVILAQIIRPDLASEHGVVQPPGDIGAAGQRPDQRHHEQDRANVG